MHAINPYATPGDAAGDVVPHGLFAGAMVFIIVLAVAAAAGAISPTIAHLAGAPNNFTIDLLRMSMMACIPFGIMVAYFASRCVRHRSRISNICWFFTVLLVVLPLEIYPKTRGPLVEYTGFALTVTIVAALVVAGSMRRFTHNTSHSD